MAPPWLEELEHTADTGIGVLAPDLPVLFERAAWGLFWIMTDISRVRPRETRLLGVEAPDREALLVRWLSELNTLVEIERMLFSSFHVIHVAETRLTGEARGEPISDGHVIRTIVKAVTFHDLRLEQTPDGWRARVLFDV